MLSSIFKDYIKELLEPIGEITCRAMFGGYGIYKDGIIFAIVDDNELYLKASNEVAKIFEDAGCEQFSYQGKKGLVKMCYWKVPSEILEDESILFSWAKLAIKSAKDSKKK
jgi:DNA transformation protein